MLMYINVAKCKLTMI